MGPKCGLHLKKWSVVKSGSGTVYTVLRLQGDEDGGKVLAVALFHQKESDRPRSSVNPGTRFLNVTQLKCAKCFDKNDYLNKYLKHIKYSRVDFNKCGYDSSDKPAWL